MTQTARRPEVDEVRAGSPPGRRRDPLVSFLRVGAAALLVLVLGFVAFYWFDQRTEKAPSIVTTQIGLAEQAIRDEPNNVQARLDLGLLYRHAGRIDEALAQYDQVLSVAPGHLDAHMGKGAVLKDKGDLLGATAEYSAVTGADAGREFSASDSRRQAAFYQLGVLALQQKQPEMALKQLESALKINRTDSDALFQAAVAMAQLGQHDQAVATLRKALTFVPTGWCQPYQELHRSYEALGAPEQARYAAAMNTFCTGDAATARTELSALVEGPAAVDALLGLGLLAQTEDDDQAAVGWYRTVLERDPTNTTAIAALAGMGITPDGAATPAPKK